jgi:hypothetical protein
VEEGEGEGEDSIEGFSVIGAADEESGFDLGSPAKELRLTIKLSPTPIASLLSLSGNPSPATVASLSPSPGLPFGPSSPAPVPALEANSTSFKARG